MEGAMFSLQISELSAVTIQLTVPADATELIELTHRRRRPAQRRSGSCPRAGPRHVVSSTDLYDQS